MSNNSNQKDPKEHREEGLLSPGVKLKATLGLKTRRPGSFRGCIKTTLLNASNASRQTDRQHCVPGTEPVGVPATPWPIYISPW